MGCYGIGASRIVAAAIEQNHDDKGIIWPNSLSPYEVAIVEANPKGKEDISAKCGEIYNQLIENKIDVLIHGHVHRPKVHNEIFGERFVLGDWDEKYWFISLDGEKIELVSGSI